MSNRITNFRTGFGTDLAVNLIDKDYLNSVYPMVVPNGIQLYAWGRNNDTYGRGGQLGDNTRASRSTPRQEFTSSTNWRQVAGGYTCSIAIKTDGTLWAWGDNFSGQLGDNTNITKSTPVQVGTATNWKQCDIGGSILDIPCSAAIKTDGTLWTWGRNTFGQLGDNTIVEKITPIQVGTATNWKQVSCGAGHMAAIKDDGTLWTWGKNDYGQIGDNTTAARSTPTQVGTATNWVQVSASTYNTAAVKRDGTLWCWGGNTWGQVGDNTQGAGTANSRSTPRQITTNTDWKQVVAGSKGSNAALKTNGTLWAWGDNSFGQLGDNTIETRSTPRQEFTSSTNWKQVTAGYDFTLAIKTDGTLWTWGYNFYGSLGDNSRTNRFTPTQEFTSSQNWIQVSSGNSHALALKGPPSP
jgi:alpha-tubulin suppressor-like RCC1 family protein